MYCETIVEQGSIRGKILEAYDGTKYYSYEGIPYAKPPVGDLRFRDPQPPDIWTGIKDCTKPGNKCLQLNPFSGNKLEGSEDCLYLNIYTPVLPPGVIEKLPVLFFIHGGRAIVGYGDYYRPDYFIRHGVILVTINYRLSILGFLCLDIPEVPGNAALKDCVYALRWVRNNINKFNGDSDNITISGESAGACIASSFLTSDMTVGLFDKVIVQSGCHVGDIFYYKRDHIAIARYIASLLGKELKDKRSIYDFFKVAPAEDLISAVMYALIEKEPYDLISIFLPVVEQVFEGVERMLKESPRESMRKNRFQKVPVLIGSNACEGAAFLRIENGKILYVKDANFAVPKHFQDSSTDFRKVENTIRSYYFGTKEIDESAKNEFIKLLSAIFVKKDILYFTETLAKYSDQIYFCDFHYDGNLNTNTMKRLKLKGATHGDLIQYQFYRKSKADKCTERDWKIIDFLSENWSNFAKYGKPTSRNQTLEWLPYTPKDKHTLIIDEENRLVKNPYYNETKFWDSIYERKSQL